MVKEMVAIFRFCKS